MAKSQSGGDAKRKASKNKGISLRLELTSDEYDALMEWSELEKRSIRGQALYLVSTGIRQWKETRAKH